MAVEQSAARGLGGGDARRVLAAPLQPLTWKATVYLLLSAAGRSCSSTSH
jgi:hypothetical protein